MSLSQIELDLSQSFVQNGWIQDGRIQDGRIKLVKMVAIIWQKIVESELN